MSTTTIIVPKDTTFKLPQGRFLARITGYKVKSVETSRGLQKNATIIFEVFVPGMENWECLARRVLPLDLRAGSELRRLLSGLLGMDYFRGKSNQAIDLKDVLVGQLCEVDLIHSKHDEERFDFPLVSVEAIYPPSAQSSALKEGGCR